MSELPIPASRVFDPSEVTALGEAFRFSWETLSAEGSARFQGRQAHYTRETIAKLVIGLARAGHTDPVAMSRAVVTEMSVC